MKGKGALTLITAELTWRRTRLQWWYGVAHLPSEANITADALSRLAEPNDEKNIPTELMSAECLPDPDVDSIWACV